MAKQLFNNEAAQRKIVAARAKMLFSDRDESKASFAFFGPLICSLAIVESGPTGVSKDDNMTTAYTNGSVIGYDPEFILSLQVGEIQTVFYHELSHNIYESFFRKGNRDHAKWNRATDYRINLDAVRDGFDPICTPHYKTGQSCFLYNPDYMDLTAEEIYDILPEDPSKDMGMGKDGKIIVGNVQPLDSSSAKETEKNEGKLEKIRADLRSAIINAANHANNRKPGSVPAGFTHLIEELIEPKISWRDYIRQTIEDVVKTKYTYMRPHRFSAMTNAILPVFDPGRSVEICSFVDMSGSTSDDMRRSWVSEIFNVSNQFDSYAITLGSFDTETYNVKGYTKYSDVDMLDHVFKGGGGTSLRCVYNHLMENAIVPKLLIVFTDGEIGDWGEPEYCRTLFVITNDSDVVPPYGEYVKYDPEL